MSLSAAAAAAGVKKVSASLKLPKGDFNACSRVFTNQLADTASDHFHFPDDECGPQRLIKTWVIGFEIPRRIVYPPPRDPKSIHYLGEGNVCFWHSPLFDRPIFRKKSSPQMKKI